MAMLRGRTRTDPLVVTEIVENLGILPMSASDLKESRRKLKEMNYRDTKTRADQRALNELESSYYDLELSSEEKEFVEEASEEEMKSLQEALENNWVSSYRKYKVLLHVDMEKY